MAHSATATNQTTAALAEHFPGDPVAVRDEVPFSSALRWSALQTDGGTWVLGAPEALAPSLRGADPAGEVRTRTAQGLRVLLLARAVEPGAAMRGADGRPELPPLEPLAVVALADELRPDVPATLARFDEEGIALKVLSGDDPDTVAALATRAGLRDAAPVHAGRLHELSDAELDAVVAEGSVFGRVAPEQKERIVVALRRQGRYVAMVGDGVNDARALKAAQVGVAMRSGSAVTRDVADIVLVDDSMAALLPARSQGRRIINGIATSTQVFLARVATQGLVIVAVTMLGLGFPYSPAQGGLTLFTVGLPTLFLTPGRGRCRPTRTCSPRWAASSSRQPCSPPPAASPCTRRSTPASPGRSPTRTSRRGSSPSSSATPASSTATTASPTPRPRSAPRRGCPPSCRSPRSCSSCSWRRLRACSRPGPHRPATSGPP